MNNQKNSEISILFGNNVKYVRKAKKVTQELLAYESNVDITIISKIERGIGNPSLKTIYKISSALSTPIASLFVENIKDFNKK